MVFQSVLLYRAKYYLSILCHFCILWAFLHLSTFALSFVTVTICRTAIVTICTYPNGVFGRFYLRFFGFVVFCLFVASFFFPPLFFFWLYIMKEKLGIMSRYHSYLKALENCCKIVLDYCNCFNNWHLRKQKPTKLCVRKLACTEMLFYAGCTQVVFF